MNTKILNKLSPSAREFIINGEGRLRQMDEEIAVIDIIINKLEENE
jgi:hypothetical protein